MADNQGSRPGETPDGWYPDPSGRHQLRRWEGGLWAEWVSSWGQVGTEAIPPPPSTGGGTLTTEPVVNLVRSGATWEPSTLYGHVLGTAAVDGRTATISDPSGAPTHQLRRSVAGSAAIVSLHDLADREVGRYEEVRRAHLSGFRVVGLGSLLATLEVQPGGLRQLSLVDPGGRPIGRVAAEEDRWRTEMAHPFGPPLAELAALSGLAVSLVWP